KAGLRKQEWKFIQGGLSKPIAPGLGKADIILESSCRRELNANGIEIAFESCVRAGTQLVRRERPISREALFGAIIDLSCRGLDDRGCRFLRQVAPPVPNCDRRRNITQETAARYRIHRIRKIDHQYAQSEMLSNHVTRDQLTDCVRVSEGGNRHKEGKMSIPLATEGCCIAGRAFREAEIELDERAFVKISLNLRHGSGQQHRQAQNVAQCIGVDKEVHW